MTKSRLKGTLVAPAAPAPDPAAPAPAPAAPAPAAPAPAAPAPAAPAPKAYIAGIEAEIEETLLKYQKSLAATILLEEELVALKESFPRQYQNVAERIGIDIEDPKEKKAFQMPDFASFFKWEIKATALQLILIALLVLGLVWSLWNNSADYLSTTANNVAEVVEEGPSGFEPLSTATLESEGMVIIPTPSVVVEATANVETSVPTEVPATAVPTAKPKPPTAVPATAVPPTAIPPTAVPAPEFWNSNAIGVFEIKGFGGVCSGDKVAGIDGPVTIAFPANYGNVEVVWGRCVVNGGTAEQIAAQDSKAWGKDFVVRDAP